MIVILIRNYYLIKLKFFNFYTAKKENQMKNLLNLFIYNRSRAKKKISLIVE